MGKLRDLVLSDSGSRDTRGLVCQVQAVGRLRGLLLSGSGSGETRKFGIVRLRQ